MDCRSIYIHTCIDTCICPLLQLAASLWYQLTWWMAILFYDHRCGRSDRGRMDTFQCYHTDHSVTIIRSTSIYVICIYFSLFIMDCALQIDTFSIQCGSGSYFSLRKTHGENAITPTLWNARLPHSFSSSSSCFPSLSSSCVKLLTPLLYFRREIFINFQQSHHQAISILLLTVVFK